MLCFSAAESLATARELDVKMYFNRFRNCSNVEISYWCFYLKFYSFNVKTKKAGVLDDVMQLPGGPKKWHPFQLRKYNAT